MAKIKDLPKVDRPREKLEKYGTQKLTDAELLAILLGSGIRGLNVLQMSRQTLKHIAAVGVKNLTLDKLLLQNGLGKAKALQIIAALELGKRLNSELKIEIIAAKDIFNQCQDICQSAKEHFLAFYLDSRNRVLERQVISIGTLNASLVHPREVFEPAIGLHSAAIIVAHNHPSGDCLPSQDDLSITRRLAESGKIIGIELLDHIIVAKTGFLSLKEKNLI